MIMPTPVDSYSLPCHPFFVVAVFLIFFYCLFIVHNDVEKNVNLGLTVIDNAEYFLNLSLDSRKEI